MERQKERQREIKGQSYKEREETGVINKGRQTFSQTDKLSRMLTDKEEDERIDRVYKNSADILPCTALCFSLLRMFLSIVKCLCFAGGWADVRSKIIASLIKGPPHGASSCCQAICSKGRKTKSALHWRMQ